MVIGVKIMVSILLFANKFPRVFNKNTRLIIQSIVLINSTFKEILIVLLTMSIKTKNKLFNTIENNSKRNNSLVLFTLPPQTIFGGTTPIITVK